MDDNQEEENMQVLFEQDICDFRDKSRGENIYVRRIANGYLGYSACGGSRVL
jgi:hypothetical protein